MSPRPEGAKWWHHGDATYARKSHCRCEPCIEAIAGADLRRMHLPLEPLMPLIRTRYPDPHLGGHGGYAAMGGLKALGATEQRRIYRAVERGWVSGWMADELATLMGLHVTEVWDIEDWIA